MSSKAKFISWDSPFKFWIFQFDFEFLKWVQISKAHNSEIYLGRVSFETSFDSKQPKLEPKLVSALSETKHLFRLFRFYTETESFDVSIEPKQKTTRNSLIGSIFFFFFQKRFYTETESFDVLIEPKQTEDPHRNPLSCFAIYDSFPKSLGMCDVLLCYILMS